MLATVHWATAKCFQLLTALPFASSLCKLESKHYLGNEGLHGEKVLERRVLHAIEERLNIGDT